MNRRTIKDPNVSPFLGLFEGKKKQREAAARIAIIEAETAAAKEIERLRQESLTLQLERTKVGFTPETDAAKQAIALTEAQQAPEKNLYIIIGFIVVAVMVGLYFIKKR